MADNEDKMASPEESMRFERRDLLKELREMCGEEPFSISFGGVPNQPHKMEFDHCRLVSLWALQKVIAHLERLEELAKPAQHEWRPIETST